VTSEPWLRECRFFRNLSFDPRTSDDCRKICPPDEPIKHYYGNGQCCCMDEDDMANENRRRRRRRWILTIRERLKNVSQPDNEYGLIKFDFTRFFTFFNGRSLSSSNHIQNNSDVKFSSQWTKIFNYSGKTQHLADHTSKFVSQISGCKSVIWGVAQQILDPS
jgi:hypothetical protein